MKEKKTSTRMEKIKYYLKKTIQCVLNPRFILCFGIGWMITNGWSYIMLAMGTYFDINWMQVVAGLYLGFLWAPFTPEKIVTVAIAIALLKFFFRPH